ncbi:ABC transporter permease subunit [Leucobacter weissii]|uniref:ABC transporter permease subunit n=1 Tax=Leucobacter weissii TaxID=1983706 RepID=A0A939MHU5_9MICO|nr:ABC transporter permease subunit [Leucobacter weissii]MBO1901013.1 ABC transporter permease subunit [Leucobacter weissii]
MTTSTATATPTAPRVRAAGAEGRLTFDGVLRSEWIKLLSLRSIRWSIAIILVLSWGAAALMGLSLSMLRDDPDLGAGMFTPENIPALLVQAASIGSSFTVLVMGVLGVLAITSEYASGLILSSLTAVPSRTPLLAAKALVVAAISFGVGALGTFGGGLIAAIFLGGDALDAYVKPEVLASMVSTSLYLALVALLALGIGFLLRSSAGAIAAVVGLVFVAPILFQVLTLTGWDWVDRVADWLPSDLGTTLALEPVSANVSNLASEGLAVEPEGVGYWAALGGLVAWAAAALVPAAILFRKRDAV